MAREEGRGIWKDRSQKKKKVKEGYDAAEEEKKERREKVEGEETMINKTASRGSVRTCKGL